MIVILVVVLIVGISRLVHKAQIKITSANGIQARTKIVINEIEQELSIYGEDKKNPIILFLHGGPGSPVSYFDYLWQPYLSEQYTHPISISRKLL